MRSIKNTAFLNINIGNQVQISQFREVDTASLKKISHWFK